MMKSSVLLLLLVLVVVMAIGGVHGVNRHLRSLSSSKSTTKWDIQPGLFSKLMKDPGHESICYKAVDQLDTPLQKQISKKMLKEGVRYNDMPGNDGTGTNVLAFGKRFGLSKMTMKNAVSRSHNGCQQFFHAQCPVSQVKGKYIVFDNSDVRDLIKDQMKNWYFDAFQKLYDYFQCHVNNECQFNHRRIEAMKKSVKENKSTLGKVVDALYLVGNVARETYRYTRKRFFTKDQSDFRVGSILHVVQDSYANGHTIRNRHGNGGCGEIALFTGYPMQSGNPFHGNADHLVHSDVDKKNDSPNAERRKELFDCAIRASKSFLTSWALCKRKLFRAFKDLRMKLDPKKGLNGVYEYLAKQQDLRPWAPVIQACRFPEDWFDQHFKLMPGTERQQCGGANTKSSAFYADGDEQKRKKMLSEAEKPVAVRILDVQYAHDRGGGGKPFLDCDVVDKPKKGFCQMHIYEPKFDYKSDKPDSEAAQHTSIVVGGTDKKAPEGIDFDLFTQKDDICDEQMDNHDKVFWDSVRKERREFERQSQEQFKRLEAQMATGGASSVARTIGFTRTHM